MSRLRIASNAAWLLAFGGFIVSIDADFYVPSSALCDVFWESFLLIGIVVVWCFVALVSWLWHRCSQRQQQKYRPRIRSVDAPSSAQAFRFARKADWVVDEVIRLKAFLPNPGIRTIALMFNRLHRTRERVSKSYVAEVIRKHRYAIAVTRRDIRNRQPRPTAINAVWGLDLCGKRTSVDTGRVSPILGIVDHGSRLAVMLQAIRNMNFYTLAGHVLIAIGRWGKPAAIRTDNASVLTSRRFEMFLRLLGIRHQRTDVGSPWQNGRVERMFGTLKVKLDQVVVADYRQLNLALGIFRGWYSEVRVHQNLDGHTPMEIWRGTDTSHAPKEVLPFSAWDGLLRGYRVRW